MGMLVFYAGNFLVGCFVLFAGGFGGIECWMWRFCGVDVVDCVGMMVCGRTVFWGEIFCSFLGFIFGGRHTPGAKAPFVFVCWEAQG
jgi:hypothetical protein